jgi:2-methylisocitrate lyase-like PEP mutase family enzyme
MSDHGQHRKADDFRALHLAEAPLVLPNVWDPGSAVIAAEAGFPALATTSAAVAWALGHPDGEQISRDKMLGAVGDIATRVSLPVTADMEAGYGRTPEEVAETVRLTIGAGAIGINLEDGLDHAAGTLLARPAAVERIAAARAALRQPVFPSSSTRAPTCISTSRHRTMQRSKRRQDAPTPT